MLPLDKANQLIQQGKLDKALGTLRRLLSKARRDEDEVMLPIVLCNLGRLYLDLGRPKQALKALEEGLAVVREEDDLPDELKATLLNNLGNVYHALGKTDAALEHYEQALAMASEINDTNAEGQTLFNLGNLYSENGRYQDALAVFERYLKILEGTHNSRDQLEALEIITDLYRETRQDQKEFESLQRMLSIAQKMKDRFREGMVLLNLGAYCQNRLRLQEAVEYCHQALEISHLTSNAALEGASLSHLGGAYLELDMYEQARDHYEHALEVLQRAGGARYLESDIHNRMAQLYADSDDWETPMHHLQRSLVLAREARDGPREREALLGLAQLYERVGNIREAVERCNQVLAIDREHKNEWGMGGALCYMGELLLRSGETKIAINQCKGALRIARRIHHSGGVANALRSLARAYCDQNRFDEAARHFEEAIEIYEAARGDVLSPEWRIARSSIGHEVYLDYIRLLVEQNEFAQALYYAERRKARVFLDLLAENRADIHQRVDPDLREKQDRLSHELRNLHQQLTAQLELADAKRDSALVASLERRERESERAYQINEAEIRRSNPRYAALVQPDTWDLNRLQEELLDEKTVLLEYVLDEPKSWLFAVSKSEIKVFLLPPKNEIETSVDELYAAIKDRLEFFSPAFNLYQALIKPAEELIREKQLLIVADEKLHYLSFAALLTAPVEQPESLSFGSLPYLIRRHTVAYAPSGSVAGFLKSDRRQRPHTWRQDLIAFAFCESLIGSAGDLAKSQSLDLRATLAHMRSLDIFKALPCTRQEVVRIASLLDDGMAPSLPKSVNAYDSESVKIRLGTGATKPALLKFFSPHAEPQPTRFVHFATHGTVDPVKPQFSGLIFNPGEDGNPFWQTFEIFNARIPSDLVVLSACETGLGKVFRGEGLVGLARAFLYAGAASVCPSLWPVDDESTADLMESFYSYLLKHRNTNGSSIDKSEALRQAQLDLVNRGGELSHPYFWAAFVLIGKWD